MTFSRFEVATRLSENVPYVDLDGGDIVLSGCDALGGKEEDIALRKCEHYKSMKFLIVPHHDGTMYGESETFRRQTLAGA